MNITEIVGKNKSLYGFGGYFQEIRDIYMDFEPCLKVHTLICGINIKPLKILTWSNDPLNMILKEVVSNYQYWFKLETHPSSLHKLAMTYRDAYLQINVD